MEGKSSKLEDKNLEICTVHRRKKECRNNFGETGTGLRFLKNEETVQQLSDSIRKANIRILGIPESEKREKESKFI